MAEVPKYEYKTVQADITTGMRQDVVEEKLRKIETPLKQQGWVVDEVKHGAYNATITFKRATGEMVEAPKPSPKYEYTSWSEDFGGTRYEVKQQKIWEKEKPLLEKGYERVEVKTAGGYPSNVTYTYRRPVGVTESQVPIKTPAQIKARAEAAKKQEAMYPAYWSSEIGKKEILELKKRQPSTAEQVIKGNIPEKYNIQTVEHSVLQDIGKKQGVLPDKVNYPTGLGGITDKQRNIVISGALTPESRTKTTTHEILHNIYPTFTEQEIRQMTEKQISALGNIETKVSSAPPKASSFIEAAQRPDLIPASSKVPKIKVTSPTVLPSGSSVSQIGQMTSIPLQKSPFPTKVSDSISSLATTSTTSPKIDNKPIQVGQVTLANPTENILQPEKIEKLPVTPQEGVEFAKKLPASTPAIGEVYKTVGKEGTTYVAVPQAAIEYEKAAKAFAKDSEWQMLAAKVSTEQLGGIKTVFEERVETKIYAGIRSVTEGIPYTEAYKKQSGMLEEKYRQFQISRIASSQKYPDWWKAELAKTGIVSSSIALSAFIPSVAGEVSSAVTSTGAGSTLIPLAKIPVGAAIAGYGTKQVIETFPAASKLESGTLFPLVSGASTIVGGAVISSQGFFEFARVRGAQLANQPVTVKYSDPISSAKYKATQAEMKFGTQLQRVGEFPDTVKKAIFPPKTEYYTKSVGGFEATLQYQKEPSSYAGGIIEKGEVFQGKWYPTGERVYGIGSETGKGMVIVRPVQAGYEKGLIPAKTYDVIGFYGGSIRAEGKTLESIPTVGRVSKAMVDEEAFTNLVRDYPTKMIRLGGTKSYVGATEFVGRTPSILDIMAQDTKSAGVLVTRFVKSPRKYTPFTFKAPVDLGDDIAMQRAFANAYKPEYRVQSKVFSFEMDTIGIPVAKSGDTIVIGNAPMESVYASTQPQYVRIPISEPISITSYQNIPSYPSEFTSLSLSSNIKAENIPPITIGDIKVGYTGSSVRLPSESTTSPTVSLGKPSGVTLSQMPMLVPKPKTSPATEISVTPSMSTVIYPMTEPYIEPMSQPRVEPRVEPRIQPISEPITEPKTEPVVEPIVDPIIEPIVKPQTQPRVEPRPQPRVEPRIQPMVESRPRTTPSTLGFPKIYWGGRVISKPKKESVVRRYRYTPTVAGVFSGKTIGKLPKIGPKEATLIRYPKQTNGSFIMKGLRNLFSRPKYKTDKKGKKSYLNNFDKALGL